MEPRSGRPACRVSAADMRGRRKPGDDIVRTPDRRRRYATPTLTRHGTLVELTFGEPIGQVETGGIIPNVFASTGTG